MPRFTHRHATSAQFPIARSTPLFAEMAAQLASDPLVEVAQRAQHLGDSEVRLPARQGFSKLCDDGGEGGASCPTGQFPHAVLELVEGLVGHLELGTVAADREAQGLAVHGPIERAFRPPCAQNNPAQNSSHRMTC